MKELINKAEKQVLILLLFPVVFTLGMVLWGYLDTPRGWADTVESQRVLGDEATGDIGAGFGTR